MLDKLSTVTERWLEWVAVSLINLASRAAVWPRPLKRAFVIVGDAVLGVLAVWIAFSLRLGEWRLFDWPVIRFTLSMLLLWFVFAHFQGIYRAIFRYAGRGTIIGLALTITFTTVPLIYFYMIQTYPGIPRTMAVLGPLIFLVLTAVARIIGRYVLVDLFHSRPLDGATQRRMIIYGAGSLGQRLAASIAAEPGMRLVGYVDDDKSKHHQRLDGFKVHHSKEIGELIVRTGATDVLLAISHVKRMRKRQIFEDLSTYPVKVQALPPMRELMVGSVTVEDMRPIEVEDLLGRSAVAPDKALLAHSVAGKRVLITGAGGSIGSEICRQVLLLRPTELVLAEANEFALFSISQELEAAAAKLPARHRPALAYRLVNVSDRLAVDRLFDEAKPQTVYHAAAYKHVPLVEHNVVAAVENNLFGTMNCAVASRAFGAERFILISTDKAVRPPNIMGASKRACELVLQALDDEDGETIFAMVRFGNVLGSSGSVVPLFKRQIAEGGPVTVTHRDVTRYFMTIPEAAQLVIQAAGMAEGGEVYVLDMGEPVRIWDLARSMIRLAGLTIREPGNDEGDIEIVESGLRPGEKLYEELLIADNPLPTSHKRVMRARETFLPMTELELEIAALRQTIDRNDPEGCRKTLKRLVPTLLAKSEVGAEHADPEAREPRVREVVPATARPTAKVRVPGVPQTAPSSS
jgi:FlaA1/EpsC-like NDP-sugar epimerase